MTGRPDLPVTPLVERERRATTRHAETRRTPTLRTVFRLLVGLVGALGLVALAQGPAAAAAPVVTNTVVSSSPSNGDNRSVAPEEIVITFAEELGEGSTMSLSCDNEPVPLGDVQIGDDDLLLTAEILEPLQRGTCVIRWTAFDSEARAAGENIISFSVSNDSGAVIETGDTTPADGDAAAVTTTIVPVAGDPAATDGSGTAVATVDGTNPDGTPVDGAAADGSSTESTVVDFTSRTGGQGPVWLGRLLSTLTIATLFGALVVIAAAWPEGPEYLVTIRFVRSVWIAALVTTLLFTAAASAAVGDRSLIAGFSPAAWIDLVSAGWTGRAVLARLVFVLGAAWVAFRPDRAIDPATQIGALGIPALAVMMTGISRTTGDLAALGVLVGVIHALAMAVWVGGVILLARVVLAGPGEEDLVHAVRSFGRISTIAIVVTVVTGVVQLIRLDGGALFDNGHGQVLLLKSVVVAGMIFVAMSARQFVAQRLARAQEMSVPLADRLRRAFGAEAGIGVVTIALSAWLLALTPPNVDIGPRVDYDVDTTFEVAGSDLVVDVRLTDATVGLAGLEVEVESPEIGLAGLNVIFTAPANDLDLGTITQPVPLTGAGVAVRREEVGIPLQIAGQWSIRVEAVVGGAQVVSDPQVLNVLAEDAGETDGTDGTDGTDASTTTTGPPTEVVTVPVTTVP